MIDRATAVFRPMRNDVAVMVSSGRDTEAIPLTVEAAALLHESLGVALRLAKCRKTPLAAVPDGPPHPHQPRAG